MFHCGALAQNNSIFLIDITILSLLMGLKVYVNVLNTNEVAWSSAEHRE